MYATEKEAIKVDEQTRKKPPSYGDLGDPFWVPKLDLSVEEKLDDDEDTSETSHSGEPGTSLCPVT
jgi:hypothetical protein